MFAMTPLEQLWPIGKNILYETEEKPIATANHQVGTSENTKEKKVQRWIDGWMDGCMKY